MFKIMFNVLLGIFSVKKYAKIGVIQPVDPKPFLTKKKIAVITTAQNQIIWNKIYKKFLVSTWRIEGFYFALKFVIFIYKPKNGRLFLAKLWLQF